MTARAARAALASLGFLALAACQSAPARLPPPPEPPKPVIRTVVKQVCLPWHEWSTGDQKALAAVIARDSMPAIVIRALIDWRRYYGDAKACIDAQK
jgi:hypothetical protein